MLKCTRLPEYPTNGVPQNIDGLGVGELGPVTVEVDAIPAEMTPQVAIHVSDEEIMRQHGQHFSCLLIYTCRALSCVREARSNRTKKTKQEKQWGWGARTRQQSAR